MARFVIQRDNPQWAICPETPWRVMERPDEPDEYASSLHLASSWRGAVEWLCEAWPVLVDEV